MRPDRRWRRTLSDDAVHVLANTVSDRTRVLELAGGVGGGLLRLPSFPGVEEDQPSDTLNRNGGAHGPSPPQVPPLALLCAASLCLLCSVIGLELPRS